MDAAPGQLMVLRPGSVKRVMKIDPDVKMVSSEAVHLVTKATELFVQEMARRSLELSARQGRRNIEYRDVAMVPSTFEKYDFTKELLQPANTPLPVVPPDAPHPQPPTPAMLPQLLAQHQAHLEQLQQLQQLQHQAFQLQQPPHLSLEVLQQQRQHMQHLQSSPPPPSQQALHPPTFQDGAHPQATFASYSVSQAGTLSAHGAGGPLVSQHVFHSQQSAGPLAYAHPQPGPGMGIAQFQRPGGAGSAPIGGAASAPAYVTPSAIPAASPPAHAVALPEARAAACPT